MLKVKNSFKREKLTEGRNFGMGFAFCKKVNDEEYHTIMYPAPCREWLNDIVWSELLDKPQSAYGLSHTPSGIFKDQAFADMFINMQPHRSGPGLFDFKKAGEVMKSNIEHMMTLINHVEEEFNIAGRTTFKPVTEVVDLDPGKITWGYMLSVPIAWTTSSAAISMYTLILRAGQFYTGELSPAEYMQLKTNPLDGGQWDTFLTIYNQLLKTKTLPTQVQVSGTWMVHGCGILAYANELRKQQVPQATTII